jgi:hypothetical protein
MFHEVALQSLHPSTRSTCHVLDVSTNPHTYVPPLPPRREHWSRVYYSIDMRLKSWMPGFVKNVLRNQALTQVRACLRVP